MDTERLKCETEDIVERHVMIAVDGSDNAERAVRFVGDFFGCYVGFGVTLLHIILEPEDTFFRDAAERRQWFAEKQEKAAKFMEAYRKILLEAGFADDKVKTRVDTMRGESVADCIIREQEEMQGSIIVIGRRGISKKEEFIFGSTSNRIIHEARKCGVLVIE